MHLVVDEQFMCNSDALLISLVEVCPLDIAASFFALSRKREKVTYKPNAEWENHLTSTKRSQDPFQRIRRKLIHARVVISISNLS